MHLVAVICFVWHFEKQKAFWSVLYLSLYVTGKERKKRSWNCPAHHRATTERTRQEQDRKHQDKSYTGQHELQDTKTHNTYRTPGISEFASLHYKIMMSFSIRGSFYEGEFSHVVYWGSYLWCILPYIKAINDLVVWHKSYQRFSSLTWLLNETHHT